MNMKDYPTLYLDTNYSKVKDFIVDYTVLIVQYCIVLIALGVPDEVYSRKAQCALNQISTFLLHCIVFIASYYKLILESHVILYVF